MTQERRPTLSHPILREGSPFFFGATGINVQFTISSSILIVNKYFEGFRRERGNVGSQPGTESHRTRQTGLARGGRNSDGHHHPWGHPRQSGLEIFTDAPRLSEEFSHAPVAIVGHGEREGLHLSDIKLTVGQVPLLGVNAYYLPYEKFIGGKVYRVNDFALHGQRATTDHGRVLQLAIERFEDL